MKGVCPALLLALTAAATLLPATAPKPAGGFTPPLYNITASSLYDAGTQHGAMARGRIQGWFNSPEMARLLAFAQADGHAAYSQLRRDSAAAYPQYAAELKGIADGSGVPLDSIWAGILMIELLNLMGETTADHCSDISAVEAGGYAHGFAHGHNEDWDAGAGEHYYYIKYTAVQGADFASCAGLAYPGALIGWAPTWNAFGMFFSVNTLVPKAIRRSGISTAFIQREAICGLGQGQNMSTVLARLATPEWSDGASINVIDTRGRHLANIETWEEQHDTLRVSARLGNSSHFNAYKRLSVPSQPSHSSTVRQARADSLPPPRTRRDIAEILSNTADGHADSILRDITIANLIVDGSSGRLDVWGGVPPASTKPLYSWNISSFFS